MTRFLVAFILFSICSVALGAGPAVTKAYVDKAGKAHIVTADGREHTIKPEKWQAGAGFEQLQIAPDGATVGWLADQELTPFEGGTNYAYPVALDLDIWRNGRVVQRMSTPDQPIMNWAFLNTGRQAAFHTGPPHGMEYYQCLLFDVANGKQLAKWSLDRRDYVVPEWAKPLLKNDPPPGSDEVSSWLENLEPAQSKSQPQR